MSIQVRENAEHVGNSALRCLASVARHYGLVLTGEQIARDHPGLPASFTKSKVARIARELGMRARSATLKWADLEKAEGAFPFLLRTLDGEWVIASGFRAQQGDLVVVDPSTGTFEFRFLDRSAFEERWSGETVLLKRAFSLDALDRPFGIGWFIPELWRRRAQLRDVAVASVFLILLGLAVPFYFQVIIDKVLVNHGIATLFALTIGVVAAILFEAAFGFIRRWLVLDASTKIDMRVSVRTFEHLLRLPVSFFDQASTGVLVKHMQQAEKIREFMTGRLLLTLLDALSLFVFLPLLVVYAWQLSLIVLAFSAIVCTFIFALMGPFRKRLRRLYELEAHRQSLMVESIQGLRTVKALALEPQRRIGWEGWSATALKARYEVGLLSSFVQTATSCMERLLVVGIVGLGTKMVFDGNLTVGGLIAFQMMTGRVSGPLTQIVSLVHEYQETALSVRMLASVMNVPPERSSRAGTAPRIQGHVQFEDVSFSYPPKAAPALADITFDVPAGTILGIVGRSGSGKTTVARLLQGMHQPDSGVIRLDGRDLREIDLAHLRGNIGVVLQENFLFRGTVRENIAIPRPNATAEQVMSAAELAGATEFIERLPRGFDTTIEENGSNLSGGQKQRLAIARALITNPPILLLDEATSALDPDSEAIIQANLKKIARGRTLIIISHRLATLADADTIMVLDRGRRVSAGTHQQLLEGCAIYSGLWRNQTRQVA